MFYRWNGGVESAPPNARFGIVVKDGTDSELLEMGESGQCNWNVLGCVVDNRTNVEVIETCEG